MGGRRAVWGRRKLLLLSNHIEHGNSGGPVFDDHGRVVAVAFAIDLESGDALAIPVSRLRSLIEGTEFEKQPSRC